jgi:hypothetical protein
MSVHMSTAGPRVRLRLPQRRGWALAVFAAVLTAAFAAASPAQAAQPGVTQISSDPYTAANAPRGQHATRSNPTPLPGVRRS